jgi:hypothetical protein
VRWTLREAHGHERRRDPAGIREHVGGVGEQRERVRQDAHRDLDGHEADDQREGDPELSPVGLPGGPVLVPIHRGRR